MTQPRTRAVVRLVGTCAVVVALAGCSFLRRPRPTVDRSADPRILSELQLRLDREPSIDAGRVRIEVDGGVVRLYGSVDGLGAWRCAILNAQLITGVVTVVDYLSIERGPRTVTCIATREEATPAPASPPGGVVPHRDPANVPTRGAAPAEPFSSISANPEPVDR